MAMPVLWTIDDDADVLQAVRNDLRQYVSQAAKASGQPPQYRVMAASSGASALDALKQLKARNEPVALFLVDQRMPEMTGVEFLEEARKLYPDAKRVLLTAYSDSDAAIRAINTVRVDYYLVKPWSPAQRQPVPHAGQTAGGMAGRLPPRFRRHSHHRRSLVANHTRHQGFFGPQPQAISMAGC